MARFGLMDFEGAPRSARRGSPHRADR